MTDICERSLLQSTESHASHALAAFVAGHRAGDGRVRIALRLPVMGFAAWQSVIERRGIADFYSLGSSTDRFPTYSVTWSTRDSEPVPIFAGALALERPKESDRVGLVVCGHYVPPFGPFGALFDAVVGQRMARATACDLLRDIAAFIDAQPVQRTAPAARGSAGTAVATPVS